MGPTYWYRKATLNQVVRGLTWYDDAYHLAETLSKDSQYTLEQCAGVIAAMSINQSWAGNVTLAKDAINGDIKGMDMVRKKVTAILECSGDIECILAVLNGDKIKTFFLNIIGDFSGVTIDRWMRRALDRPTDRAAGKAYRKDQAKIREIATKFGYTPAQYQAIVWVSIVENGPTKR